MSSHTLSLAARRLSVSHEPVPTTPPAQLFLVPQAAAARAPRPEGPQLLSSQTRGLHLVTEAPASRPAGKADSSARARSIVAQVEWEIAQQASRRPTIARLLPAKVPEANSTQRRESPWTVALRLFHALTLARQ